LRCRAFVTSMHPRQVVRRARQLFAGLRSSSLSRNRLRQVTVSAGGNQHRDDGEERRGSKRLLELLGMPFAARRGGEAMAKKSMIAKAKRPPGTRSRLNHRCFVCGRPRAFMRRFGLCRSASRGALLANCPASPSRAGRESMNVSDPIADMLTASAMRRGATHGRGRPGFADQAGDCPNSSAGRLHRDVREDVRASSRVACDAQVRRRESARRLRLSAFSKPGLRSTPARPRSEGARGSRPRNCSTSQGIMTGAQATRPSSAAKSSRTSGSDHVTYRSSTHSRPRRVAVTIDVGPSSYRPKGH